MAPICPRDLLDPSINNHMDLNLDISGVAGFFGGDVAVSAMTTVHIYEGRMYLGWYNTPGSYEIARRYGQLARSRFWNGLYPGDNEEAATLFKLDGSEGPKFRGVQSGTIMRKTSHPARLFFRDCAHMKAERWTAPKDHRKTNPSHVTVAHLRHVPQEVEHLCLTKDGSALKTTALALCAILASAATAVLCALGGDWICFGTIVLGMVSSGISCWIIGTGTFRFTHPRPAQASPPGHGILDENNAIVVLKGPEAAVSAITRGRFSLDFAESRHFHRLGFSSLLLTVQFLVQLLAVPQGTNFGQIMFLASLGVSWAYNSYLASLDREKLQCKVLRKNVLRLDAKRGDLRRYEFGTRTAMVVFALLVLASEHDAPLPVEGVRASEDDAPAPGPSEQAQGVLEEAVSLAEKAVAEGGEEDGAARTPPPPTTPRPFAGVRPPAADSKALREALNDLMPNDTHAWVCWKEAVLEQIPRVVDGEAFYQVHGTCSKEEQGLLKDLYKDAEAAAVAYREYSRISKALRMDSLNCGS